MSNCWQNNLQKHIRRAPQNTKCQNLDFYVLSENDITLMREERKIPQKYTSTGSESLANNELDKEESPTSSYFSCIFLMALPNWKLQYAIVSPRMRFAVKVEWATIVNNSLQ